MFNEEQKLRFIKDTAKSVNYQRDLKQAFDKTESLEVTFDLDLCMWDAQQLRLFFTRNKYTSILTIRSDISAIRSYCTWAKNSGYDTSGAIYELDPNSLIDLSAYREKYFPTPEALCEYMDRLFNCDKFEKAEIATYRMYYWMAFAGVPENRVWDISCSMIALDDLIVVLDDNYIYLPQCCADDVACVYNRANCHGNLKTPILQLFNKGIASGHVGSYMKYRINKGISRPSFHNVKQSGLFYKAYLQEQKGFPVDSVFDSAIERTVRESGYNGWGDSALKRKVLNNRRSQLRRSFKSEYAAWKAAFNLK